VIVPIKHTPSYLRQLKRPVRLLLLLASIVVIIFIVRWWRFDG
jgi:hypothetical protein